MMYRGCVFAHYDKNNQVQDYVYYYLKELLTVVQELIFVTVSDITNKDINQLKSLNIKVIKRENLGYDFYSYKIGLEGLQIDHYDELIICNDSVFGPLTPIKSIFDNMKRLKCDFWGITDSTLHSYHIQSYFLVFRKRVLVSSSFCNFWNNVHILDDKEQIIQLYEVGLSQYFIKNTFVPAVYVQYRMPLKRKISTSLINVLKKPYKVINFIKNPLFYYHNIADRKCNPTIEAWEILLERQNIPFVKKSLFSSQKESKQNLLKLGMLKVSYDINLIRDYINNNRM